ncbi:hypothetical protein OG921_19130 [Aldersonia sp. NBC_00410]|uniref:hypothetical protein n=1 Tax=Aldersonia sp. NBC_00410 TaxID=2975954 RepID=UPI00225170AA|nr:hypothetical protein [Aldersonia sp. NBC_00410]MCX5045282.1 hypothetical protein [Aldersonia sp. NBC_00410]
MRYLFLYRSPTGPERQQFPPAAQRAGVLLVCDNLGPPTPGIRSLHRADIAAEPCAPTGVAIIDVRSLDEATEWANRFADDFDEIDLTVHPILES